MLNISDNSNSNNSNNSSNSDNDVLNKLKTALQGKNIENKGKNLRRDGALRENRVEGAV